MNPNQTFQTQASRLVTEHCSMACSWRAGGTSGGLLLLFGGRGSPHGGCMRGGCALPAIRLQACPPASPPGAAPSTHNSNKGESSCQGVKGANSLSRRGGPAPKKKSPGPALMPAPWGGGPAQGMHPKSGCELTAPPCPTWGGVQPRNVVICRQKSELNPAAPPARAASKGRHLLRRGGTS